MKPALRAQPSSFAFSRRVFVAGSGLCLAAAILPERAAAQAGLPAAEPDGFSVLRARPGTAALRGVDQPPTAIWGYDGTVPGPLLRVKQGEELKVRLLNELPEATAVHWHGLRAPNAMDGVPELTQPAVVPGATFDYRFRAPDAGTFWYHAPLLARGQAARGLYGALVVDEAKPPPIDRDVLMIFDDWRDDQPNVNGRPNLDIPVRTNERVRLRLINAARSRLFGVGIAGERATVVAIDGQPAEPFEARDGRVLLGPGTRVDVFVEATGAPGSSSPIVLATARGPVPIARLVYEGGDPARPAPLPSPQLLPATSLPARMDFKSALKFDIPLDGAAMRTAIGGPGARELANQSRNAPVWTPADQAAAGQHGSPLFRVKRGRTVMLALQNKSGVPYSLHLHGHSCRLLDALDDGWKPFWLDTLLAMPEQTTRIAFVADNPGKWMITCLPIEHPGEGAGTWFEVA